MSDEVSDNVAVINAEKGDDGQEIASSFNALRSPNPAALGSIPSCVSPTDKPLDSGERAPDSGYGSNSSTPDRIKHTPILLRKPGQAPLIRQTGLCVSNKPMQAVTKRRFREVQLEIEKMLLEFIRKTKPGPERYKPIAIRLMMLGKTETDAEAKSYMVVICSENIKRKVQDFFEEPLVKSLCEPDDDDVPSFKALIIGHALRLRASTSNISVQCGAMNSFYDGTRTFCGMPIRLVDESGHSRNATFGGMVRLTSTQGESHLYGLTAGHVIRDSHVVKDEDETGLADINGNDLLDLNLTEHLMEGLNDQIRSPPPETTDDINWDDSDNGCFHHNHHLGKIIDVNAPKNLTDGEEGQMKPRLDWALFELTAHRPNQIAFHGREHSKGDLHLPLSTLDPSKDEIPVSMLCASQGVKHGVLSTTCARVLLDPGESFTDAYTLSLEGSEVSDGDSGSWVVDEPRLEVYGHVVADDVFGNAYVIPMNDILADIQRCLGAESVDLPSGLDAAFNDDASITSADFVQGPSRSSWSVDSVSYAGPDSGYSSRRDVTPAPSKKLAFDDDENDDPLFLCPFYVGNRYPQHKCSKRRFKRVSDVRQHLLRAHIQDPHCPTCGAIFDNDRSHEQLHGHIAARTCQSRSFIVTGITADQFGTMTEIARQRNPRRHSAAERWLDIWRVIFPDADDPYSPYESDETDFIQGMLDTRDALMNGRLRALISGTHLANFGSHELSIINAFIGVAREFQSGHNDAARV